MDATPAKEYTDLDIVLLGIELGLADLFNDDEAAMLEWLTTLRPEFNWLSAAAFLRGIEGDEQKLSRAKSVADVLNQARNLD